MSHVYEALQQCAPEAAAGSLHPTQMPDVAFLERIDATWDPLRAAKVTPDPSRLHALPVLHSPGTFLTEQFRYLSTRLHQIREWRQLRTVVVASSVAEEGKSFVSTNLAISLSRGGRNKVLLLEADLRRPSQCRTLGLPLLAGLSEWYNTGESSAVSAVYEVSGAGYWLLPAGISIDRPLEVVTSKRFPDLLIEMSNIFDWIVVDTPPMLPMADAGVISHLCDGTLLTVRRETTPKSGLTQALARLEPGKLLGVILNDFEAVNRYGYERYYGKGQEVRRP